MPLINIVIVNINPTNIRAIRTGEGAMFKAGMDVQLVKIISLFKSMDKHFKKCALKQIEELASLYAQYKSL